MSDERLREAERRWRETGAVEDEARYLLERVRVGDLTRERLELAAYCGHDGARWAGATPAPSMDNVQVWLARDAQRFFGRLTGPAESEWKRRYPDADWIGGLSHWGKAALVSAGLGATEAFPSTKTPVVEVRELAMLWFQTPTDSVAVRARAWSETALLAASDGGDREVWLCAHYLAAAIGVDPMERLVPCIVRCGFAAVERLGPASVSSSMRTRLVALALCT